MFDDIFSCFDTIPACDRQPERQADGQHSPRYAYASRGITNVHRTDATL